MPNMTKITMPYAFNKDDVHVLPDEAHDWYKKTSTQERGSALPPSNWEDAI